MRKALTLAAVILATIAGAVTVLGTFGLDRRLDVGTAGASAASTVSAAASVNALTSASPSRPRPRLRDHRRSRRVTVLA